jgi:bacillolysin
MKIIFLTAILLGLSCANHIDPSLLRLEGRTDVEITTNEDLGTPSRISGGLADLSGIKKEKRPEALIRFFSENTSLFKLSDPEKELRLIRAEGDELGFTHYRFERVHGGVPVYLDELILHVNAKSSLYRFDGNYHQSLRASAQPSVSAEKAGRQALESAAARRMERVDQTELIFYPSPSGMRLAWHVTLGGGLNQWDYFIDGLDGSVLFDQDRRRF